MRRAIVLTLLAIALIGGIMALLRGRDEDAWTVTVPVHGRWTIELRAARLIQLATSPPGRWLLNGHSVVTRWGVVHIRRSGDGVELNCTPCTVRHPALSRDAIQLAAVELAVARRDDVLTGTVRSGRIKASFSATLRDDRLDGSFAVGETPIRDVYVLLGQAIPELERARIDGSLSARGRFSLPDAYFDVDPHLRGFQVRGLVADRLAYGRVAHACAGRQGEWRRREIGEGGVDWLPLRKMGRLLPRAVIAGEDARFFEHPGYDLVEVRAALTDNLAGSRVRRGGSTLTQQLARSLFLGQERTLVRKLRELLYAVEMEQTLGKQRILALYLNTVDWGPGLCGASEAAQAYFGKAPAELRPEEAAWLAGILVNPHVAWREEYLTGRPKTERVRRVLKRMAGLRRGERRLALARPLQFKPIVLEPVASVVALK